MDAKEWAKGLRRHLRVQRWLLAINCVVCLLNLLMAFVLRHLGMPGRAQISFAIAFGTAVVIAAVLRLRSRTAAELAFVNWCIKHSDRYSV